MRGHRSIADHGSWRSWALAGLTALVAVAAPAQAQQADESRHVVDREEAWRTMAEKAERADEQRAMVRSVLDRPEVGRVAEAHGLDLTRARDAVSTLDGAELQQVAERAQTLDRALAGGDSTVVISTTTIIIALLVLIIILVA